jgi:FtsZ-binding cell division protein ZapB
MKRIFAMLVLLVTVLAVTGCGANSLADYKKALDKTDQITKGQSSGEFAVTMDFNTDGMTQAEINELNYYKDMSGNFKKTFDSSENQRVCRNYINMGGLGFDIDIFKNGEEMFIKLPIIGKYMKLDEMIKEIKETPEEKPNFVSDDTLEAIGEAWVGMLKEEDIFKGKDIVLTTPDGEVKTTVYTITLNDVQIKAFAEKAISILSEDEALRSNIEDLLAKNADQTELLDFDELVDKIKEYMEKDSIDNFQYTAYVDIDGYIVNEVIEVEITKVAKKAGEPKEISFLLELKNFDINKDQKIEFPVLTEENTLKTDELGQTMPSLFKNMFQTQ